MKILFFIFSSLIYSHQTFAIEYSKESAFLSIQLTGSSQTETTYLPVHNVETEELYKHYYSLTINLENPEIIPVQTKCTLTTWMNFVNLKNNTTKCAGLVFEASNVKIISNSKDNSHLEITGRLKNYNEITDYVFTEFKNFEISGNIISFEISNIPTDKEFNFIESIAINKKSSPLAMGSDRNKLSIYDNNLAIQYKDKSFFYYTKNSNGTFRYNINIRYAGFSPKKGKPHNLYIELNIKQNTDLIWHVFSPKDIKTRFSKEVIFK